MTARHGSRNREILLAIKRDRSGERHGSEECIFVASRRLEGAGRHGDVRALHACRIPDLKRSAIDLNPVFGIDRVDRLRDVGSSRQDDFIEPGDVTVHDKIVGARFRQSTAGKRAVQVDSRVRLHRGRSVHDDISINAPRVSRDVHRADAAVSRAGNRNRSVGVVDVLVDIERTAVQNSNRSRAGFRRIFRLAAVDGEISERGSRKPKHTQGAHSNEFFHDRT